MNDPFNKNAFNIMMQPIQQSFSASTTYYYWGNAKGFTTTPTTNFSWYTPPQNMIITDVTVWREGAALPTTERTVLSLNERYQFHNTGSYPATIRNINITKNFNWVQQVGSPMGWLQRFSGLWVPMVVGRLYALKFDIPAMGTTPVNEQLTINLQGVYED